jgi:hypothetical protein
MQHSGGQLSLTQMDTDALRARRWTRIFGEVSSNLSLLSPSAGGREDPGQRKIPCRFELVLAKGRASTNGETWSKDLASFATNDEIFGGQVLVC